MFTLNILFLVMFYMNKFIASNKARFYGDDSDNDYVIMILWDNSHSHKGSSDLNQAFSEQMPDLFASSGEKSLFLERISSIITWNMDYEL